MKKKGVMNLTLPGRREEKGGDTVSIVLFG